MIGILRSARIKRLPLKRPGSFYVPGAVNILNIDVARAEEIRLFGGGLIFCLYSAATTFLGEPRIAFLTVFGSDRYILGLVL